MKKHLLIAAIAITALASCSSNDFVGDESPQTSSGTVGAISFTSGTPAITRVDKSGSAAATDLNNNFVVFGYKTMSDDSKQTVFSNYQANYVTNTANTTESNSAGWEYVGYKNLTANMTGNTGVAGNTTSGLDQTIKYWDYSASNYKFYAYSLGTGKAGTPNTYANASLMSTSNTYTLEGDQDQLTSCYVSELQTISSLNSSTPKEVDLRFLSFKSMIQLGFYETIPGYSVKLLKFYDSSTDETSDDTPVLFAGSSTLPKKGTYTVTFDANGKPQLAWAAAASEGAQANVSFSSTLTNYAAKDYEETAENVYLGRTSNAATKTEVKNVLPFTTGADLTLKVDYTLISRDGTGETIEVKGATAKVPAAFTQWKPNYKYTYLFKISDNTNGSVGTVTGLYPITLDAVVASEQDGSQETITTVSEPSITTYQNLAITNEYTAGTAIYVVVGDGTTTLTAENAKLYTATIEAGAAQGLDGSGNVAITEEQVANVLTKTPDNNVYTVTDANGKKLTVTASNELSILNANEVVGGITFVTSKAAKFTPADNTVYVFEYIYQDNNETKKAYKVIKVGSPTPIQPAPEPEPEP